VTEPAKVDTTRPNNARVYDYLLGGRDNFAADRSLADRMVALLPIAKGSVRAQRYVLARVIRYMIRDEGVTQLLDIGSGLPTVQNVHQIAQRLDQDARVVYLDNDPVVISHATALLADDRRTFAVRGDLRDPEGVLSSARELLDWNRPIGLVLCGILHFLSDEEKPAALTAALIDALPSGSCVFINHMVQADDSASLETIMRQGLGRVRFRTREQILELFGGLELVEPGLVPAQDWRPDGPPSNPPLISLSCSGVAKKPLLLIISRGASPAPGFRRGQTEHGGYAEHPRRHAERRRIRHAIHQESGRDRAGHCPGVPGHLVRGHQCPALPVQQVTDHRRRRGVEQPGAEPGDRERREEGTGPGQYRQHDQAGRRDGAAGHDYRPPPERVGEPAAG
jgi:hypothetical protein